MRRLTKVARPQILVDNEAHWTAALLAAAPGTVEFKQIERRYGHEEIRSCLADETLRKCAYCESQIEAVAFPHIEHMQPKAKHRELTFVWRNLTLGCQVCNTRKGDEDINENNFVHPYEADPESRFHFVGGVMAVAAADDLAAVNMINWLDLNRAPLVISRNEIVVRVIEIYLQAVRLPIDARRQFLTLAIARFTGAEHRHSRVAQCVAQICESRYGDQLASDV